MMIAAALLALAAQADRAGNRVVPFTETAAGARDADTRAPRCTPDRRWCARLATDAGQTGWWLEVFAGAPEGSPVGRVALADPAGDSHFALLGEAVAEADGALLIEIERSRATGYSGGGASATFRRFVRVAQGRVAPVLEVPTGGVASIRACFSEASRRARRGACSDEYEFIGALALDPATAAGPPRFVLTTRARTAPGRRSRGEDSTRIRLRPSQLGWAADPACSYRRVFAFDAATGAYAPDRPLPACIDYLDF